MFSTLVFGLEHCIQPICRTLAAIEEVSWGAYLLSWAAWIVH